MTQQLKTECQFCKVMWMEPMKEWTAHDRMMYSMHLKIHHGWVREIEA